MPWSRSPLFDRLPIGDAISRSCFFFLQRTDFFFKAGVFMYLARLLVDLQPMNVNTIAKEAAVVKRQVIIYFLWVLLKWAVFVGCGIMGQAIISRAVLLLHVKRVVDGLECLEQVMHMTWSLLFVHCLFGLAIAGIYVLFGIFSALLSIWKCSLAIFLDQVLGIAVTIPVLYVALPVMFVGPTLLAEGKHGVYSTAISVWELSSGSRVFMFLCSFWLQLSFFAIWTFMWTFFGRLNLFAPAIHRSIANLPFLVFFPLQAILQTVIYLHVRKGREGLNSTVLGCVLDRVEDHALVHHRHQGESTMENEAHEMSPLVQVASPVREANEDPTDDVQA